MPTLVVEIHVPLTAAPDVPEGAYPYPWLLDLDEHVMDLDLSRDGAECHDDSEDDEGVCVWFVTGPSEERLLEVAAAVAARPGVPGGVFAVVTDDGAEGFGAGRRVDLPRR